jgi:protein-S-isoprenylcysteine O-methyltransferase Ste14
MRVFIAAKVVLGLWLVFVVVWFAWARAVKPTALRVTSRGTWLVVRLLIVALVFAAFRYRVLQLSPFPRDMATSAIGLALCVGGLAFALWARAALGANWSQEPSVKEEHELVTAGPYRLVRHPIYTGILVALVGTALIAGLVGWIVVVVTSAMFAWRVRVEEQLMEQTFPGAYATYRQHTKALVPGVW